MSNIRTLGIDTSKWQNSKVDYYQAKQAGMEFVFLRIGYNKTFDTCFEKDYKAAVAAGLKVGAYFYTLSTTTDQATADATRVLGWLADRHLDFPVAYDVEDSRQKKASMKDTNAKMYNAFKNKLEEGGVYDAMLYTGEAFYNSYFNKNLVTDDLWIAKYNMKEPSVGRDIAIWQFSSDYISTSYWTGKLDRNALFADSFQGSRTKYKAKTTNPYPEPAKTIRKTVPCTKGNEVKWIQWELMEAELLSEADIDGAFGTKTKEAVKDFQKKHGLQVDGAVGPATRYAMKND